MKTAGASGTIPSVLKYVTEFISQDPEKDVMTFLLTVSKVHLSQMAPEMSADVVRICNAQASAIGMLFKRSVIRLRVHRCTTDIAHLAA